VVGVEPLDEEGNLERRRLEDLRRAEKRRVVVQARTTKKWRRRVTEP
jgi:hypothetical protein